MIGWMESWTSLPNLHPIAVHLPIALLPLAAIVDLFAVARPRATWLDRTATLLYVVGAAGAGLAVWVGERAAESFVGLPPRMQPRIAEHSDWGHWVWYLFAVVAVARLAVCWRDRNREELAGRAVRVVLLVLAGAGLVLLARAADMGGALVYRHGLGVTAMGEPGDVAARVSEGEASRSGADSEGETGAAGETGSAGDAATRISVDETGIVRWNPAPGDAARLSEIGEAMHGTSLDAVAPASTGDTANGPDRAAGLTLAVNGRLVLALTEEIGDVQVDAEVELGDFEGSIGVAHHLGSGERGGFFTLSTEGSARLVDRRDSSQDVLDEQRVELPAGPLVLAVSSAGRHLKGLVDGETVTHGHIGAPPPGRCGLFLDGTGTVRIVRVVVTPLTEG